MCAHSPKYYSRRSVISLFAVGQKALTDTFNTRLRPSRMSLISSVGVVREISEMHKSLLLLPLLRPSRIYNGLKFSENNRDAEQRSSPLLGARGAKPLILLLPHLESLRKSTRRKHFFPYMREQKKLITTHYHATHKARNKNII